MTHPSPFWGIFTMVKHIGVIDGHDFEMAIFGKPIE
jgi:hypothetical protein